LAPPAPLVAFLQTFASIFDFRFNHKLLPRSTSLLLFPPTTASHIGQFFTYEPPTQTLSSELPFTREGGWGWGPQAYLRAPGDVTALTIGNKDHPVGGVSAGSGTSDVTELGGNYRMETEMLRRQRAATLLK
jgi:diacylglycerol diphosphate phosphatase / phosphatidate phosphatase